jgi:hypothetical protein
VIPYVVLDCRLSGLLLLSNFGLKRQEPPKGMANALESELRPLARSGLITKLSKREANPANTHQQRGHPGNNSSMRLMG